MGKRSRLDIIGDMLRILSNNINGIKPTQLMYKSNLSHGQMQGYLNELIAKEFIEKVTNKNKTVIQITDKGRAFVYKLQEIKEFEEGFGL